MQSCTSKVSASINYGIFSPVPVNRMLCITVEQRMYSMSSVLTSHESLYLNTSTTRPSLSIGMSSSPCRFVRRAACLCRFAMPYWTKFARQHFCSFLERALFLVFWLCYVAYKSSKALFVYLSYFGLMGQPWRKFLFCH